MHAHSRLQLLTCFLACDCAGPLFNLEAPFKIRPGAEGGLLLSDSEWGAVPLKNQEAPLRACAQEQALFRIRPALFRIEPAHCALLKIRPAPKSRTLFKIMPVRGTRPPFCLFQGVSK